MDIKDNGLLFLNGGGDENDSMELDKAFVSYLHNNDKILYIPHANKKQYPEFSSSLKWLTSTLNSIDNSKRFKIYIPKSYQEFELVNLNEYSAVYIGGGNTYFLLNILDKYKFTDKLISYFHSGGIIYGGSAGAIILGKSIKTASDEKIINYDLSNGLNLIHGYSIVCHADESIIKDLDKRSDLKPILALYENSGILIKKNRMSFFGKKYEQLD